MTGIERESDSVIAVRLDDPAGASLPPARPGQYLTLRLRPETGQRSLLRNYSLSGPGGGPTIEFARSNLAIPWSSDVPVRWSCRTGVCHTCETTLVAGDVGYSPDPVEPPAEGSALICCSQPRDDVVLDL